MATAVVSLLLFTLLTVNHAAEPDTNNPVPAITPIKLEITTHLGDRQTFVEGDTLSFLLSLDSDAYLLIIYEDAASNLIQLLPNSRMGNNLQHAGVFLTIPPANAGFRFKVRAPFGAETLWAFASDVPFPELKGKRLNNGLKLLDSDIPAIQKQLLALPRTAFGRAKLSIFTKSRD